MAREQVLARFPDAFVISRAGPVDPEQPRVKRVVLVIRTFYATYSGWQVQVLGSGTRASEAWADAMRFV